MLERCCVSWVERRESAASILEAGMREGLRGSVELRLARSRRRQVWGDARTAVWRRVRWWWRAVTVVGVVRG